MTSEMTDSFNISSLGEILIRLSASEGQLISNADSFNVHMGGSEANVLLSLSQWGHQCTFLTKLPSTPLGDKALKQLNMFGLNMDAIQRGGDRLGLYFEEKGSGFKSGYIVYDRSHSAVTTLHPDEVDWEAFFSKTDWFHWSAITPSLSANCLALTQKAVSEAKQRKIPISVDLHNRKNLWQFGVAPWDVLNEMVEGSDIVVTDPNTLVKTFRKDDTELLPDFISSEDALAFFEKFSREQNLNRLAMLHRDIKNAAHHTLRGLLYDSNSNEGAQSQVFEVYPIIDRIGGGDAFMAGLIQGYLKRYSTQLMTDFATGASVIKHSIKGDFNQATENEILNMIHAKTKGIINR